MKKVYWLVQDNGDLSVYVSSLAEAREVIDVEFEALKEHLPMTK